MAKTASTQRHKPRNAPLRSKRRKTTKSGGHRAPSARRIATSGTPAASRSTAEKQRADTKQARVIALLRTPAGATIVAMIRATGWQQHSVRGFLAGIVRKKLGLSLTSESSEGGRVYRINDPAVPTAGKAA